MSLAWCERRVLSEGTLPQFCYSFPRICVRIQVVNVEGGKEKDEWEFGTRLTMFKFYCYVVAHPACILYSSTRCRAQSFWYRQSRLYFTHFHFTLYDTCHKSLNSLVKFRIKPCKICRGNFVGWTPNQIRIKSFIHICIEFINWKNVDLFWFNEPKRACFVLKHWGENSNLHFKWIDQ